MSSLYGQFNHSVDSKGRLAVPFKFRDILGSSLVIVVDPDGSLRIYSAEQFDNFIADLEEKIDTSSPRGRKLLKTFTANASSCELDSQGRIIIPPVLRKYANITKEVVVIGAGTKAEVWDKDRYEERFGDTTEESLSDLVSEFGIKIG